MYSATAFFALASFRVTGLGAAALLFGLGLASAAGFFAYCLFAGLDFFGDFLSSPSLSESSASSLSSDATDSFYES